MSDDPRERVSPGAAPRGQRPVVIDTSLFSNPQTRSAFGVDASDAVRRFLELAVERDLELYLPLSVFRELEHFASAEAMARLRNAATVRGPDIYAMQVPAAILHSFIGRLRERVNRGLRIVEQAVRSEDAPATVRLLREQYRQALRGGIVDSVEDLEVVLLAREVGGAVVSADEGIGRMAGDLGLEVLSAAEFVQRYGRRSGE